MITWIMENMATILISAALILAVGAAIASMVRGRKKGKSSCGCGCADCPAGNLCAANASRRPQKKE